MTHKESYKKWKEQEFSKIEDRLTGIQKVDKYLLNKIKKDKHFCRKCDSLKESDKFYIRKNKKEEWIIQKPCIECTKKYKKEKVSEVKNIRLKKAYNISNDEYNIILLNQNNSCAICEKHKSNFNKELSVDHCHNSNKIRGILCNDCNVGLGFFKDDIRLFKKAINYLKFNNIENLLKIYNK